MSKYSDNMPPELKDAIGWLLNYVADDGRTFLDFGCSTGYFGSLIKQAKNAKVYGVEISSDRDEARKVLDGVYSFDLDADWPANIYERKYDYVFYGDVLEHLKAPGRSLELTRKLLKPGGKVFVSIPNIAHMSVRLELLQGNFVYEPMGILDNTHVQYFTRESFTRIAAQAGYDVEYVTYTQHDYPKDVIEKFLAAEGLTPTREFWKIAESVEARAYQYKFVLTLRAAQAKPKTPAQPEKPNAELGHYTEDLKLQVKNLRQHAEEQAKLIEALAAENKQLKRQIGTEEPSLPRRAATKLKGFVKKQDQ